MFLEIILIISGTGHCNVDEVYRSGESNNECDLYDNTTRFL